MKTVGNFFWKVIETISVGFLKLFFKILRKEPSPEVTEGFLQFVKFGIVGVSNTLLSYFINIGVLLVLAPQHVSWDYFAGNIISFILSVLWSFYWNNKYVFKQKDGQKRNLWMALLKTYVSYSVTGLVMTNILSFVWVDLLGISKFVAPMINLIISVPVNFILNKFWAFKTETKTEE